MAGIRRLRSGVRGESGAKLRSNREKCTQRSSAGRTTWPPGWPILGQVDQAEASSAPHSRHCSDHPRNGHRSRASHPGRVRCLYLQTGGLQIAQQTAQALAGPNYTEPVPLSYPVRTFQRSSSELRLRNTCTEGQIDGIAGAAEDGGHERSHCSLTPAKLESLS